MNIHCNAGISTTNMVGDLAGYGSVCYHESEIANILSLVPEDYITQVFDDPTNIDDPQNDILNTEDSKSYSVYDKTTVDHATNNANEENAEAMVDITNAKEKLASASA
jgi:hypothetical protein